MKIKLDKKSEALLKEMLRKNSRYGSLDLMLNEAVGVFYASERKKEFSGISRLSSFVSKIINPRIQFVHVLCKVFLVIFPSAYR